MCAAISVIGSQGRAALQMRNLTSNPEFICPGQQVTLTFQVLMSATNLAANIQGVISLNDATWQDASDYYFADNGPHSNSTTAATATGVPVFVYQYGVTGDLFWHTYTWRTTIPNSAPYTGATTGNFIIRGMESQLNAGQGTAYDAQLILPVEFTCTKKAVYNSATLWEQESTARLVISNSCGTPSFTPTRTATRTATMTATPSITPSVTPTRTSTATPSATLTVTSTPTSTVTFTSTSTYSATPTATQTRTVTFSVTETNSPGPSPTFTATRTHTPTSTSTPTYTATPTATSTRTVTFSMTDTNTPGPTATNTVTPSNTPSITETMVFSATNTPTNSQTPTATPTHTETATWSSTRTPSPSATETVSFTSTQTRTETPTATGTWTNSFTPTESPSFTVSPTVSPTLVPVPYQVQVIVYNAAGEKVRVLFNGAAEKLPTDINLSTSLLQIGANQVDLNMGGLLNNGSTLVSWKGQNDNGQTIVGGTYYFKIEYHDPFGTTTSYTKSVQVIQGQAANYMAVYNSAGEEVYRADLLGLPERISDFSIKDDIIALAYKPDGSIETVLDAKLTDVKGVQTPFSWDGRGMQGQPLAAGTYTVKLINETATGTVTVARSVTLIKAADPSLPFEPFAAPNPAPAQGSPGLGRNLSVGYPATSLFGARCDLYNQAGEKVRSAGDPSATGRILLSYEDLASGIYLVELRGVLVTGAPYRRILKAAILH